MLGIPFNIAFGLQDFLKSIFREEWWIFPLVVSTVLATIGPYIYIYIQKKAEDRILQEQRQYQATLRQASLGMGQIKDLKRLLNLIVHVVTRAVKIENCKIFLRHEDSKRFVLKAVKGEKNNVDEKNHLGFDSLLVNYFNQVKEPIVYEEVKQRRTDIGGEGLGEIEAILEKMDAALVVPSFIEQKLIAIISLGKKRSGKLYTHDDLAVFAILANQSALAIENAQFYEDMKRTHVQLLKAEKMATVGTMADGLSHQINNRLHAMGFIAGDLIDTIRHGKQNGHPPKTKELLEEIESGLERIQQNVKHGGEIVGGLLRYTRKGEKGFAPVELSQLLKSALEMAQFKIKVNMLDIERHFDDSIPKIKGNFTQLQEVFFNLIDNAYDAMMQRKEELQEKGYKPHLDIYAREVNAKIEIIIQDNGMGVKDSDMHKLFTPFFTTKATSKKGTGLGLYVIRQIIEDNHGGKVNFSSKFKIGSETQIILPIALEKTA
ncbi:MAG: ATP-binding protein [Candidatus Omnitrophota bacterium]